jgi:hypothetical protein
LLFGFFGFGVGTKGSSILLSDLIWFFIILPHSMDELADVFGVFILASYTTYVMLSLF